ncbi:MAG: glycerate kinase [Elusimicrobiota bacterium]|nr:glycerate kinase [Elusimicrobiota bacterium]
MNILIAPNSFKGTLNACMAGKAIAKGLRKVMPKNTLKLSPISDGGDGLIDIALNILGGQIKTLKVEGPLKKQVKARYIFCKDKTVIIEMAEASGIKYLSSRELDVMNASTFGVGQLISKALKLGAKKIIIGLGGSASNDGGAGCAQGFGFKLKDIKGKDISRGVRGLSALSKVDNNIGRKLKKTEFVALTDVSNLLCGREGSARIFGPQKGASRKDVKAIEKALSHYSNIIKRDLKKNIERVKGGAAAGGLAAGLYAFFCAALEDGTKYVFDIAGIERDIKKADIIITGEGKFDRQSLFGKGFYGLSALALKHNKPIIVVCGKSLVRSKKILSAKGVKYVIELEKVFKGKNLFIKPEKWLKKAFEIESEKIMKLVSRK